MWDCMGGQLCVGLDAVPGSDVNVCPSLPPPLPVRTPVHALQSEAPRQTFLKE